MASTIFKLCPAGNQNRLISLLSVGHPGKKLSLDKKKCTDSVAVYMQYYVTIYAVTQIYCIRLYKFLIPEQNFEDCSLVAVFVAYSIVYSLLRK